MLGCSLQVSAIAIATPQRRARSFWTSKLTGAWVNTTWPLAALPSSGCFAYSCFARSSAASTADLAACLVALVAEARTACAHGMLACPIHLSPCSPAGAHTAGCPGLHRPGLPSRLAAVRHPHTGMAWLLLLLLLLLPLLPPPLLPPPPPLLLPLLLAAVRLGTCCLRFPERLYCCCVMCSTHMFASGTIAPQLKTARLLRLQDTLQGYTAVFCAMTRVRRVAQLLRALHQPLASQPRSTADLLLRWGAVWMGWRAAQLQVRCACSCSCLLCPPCRAAPPCTDPCPAALCLTLQRGRCGQGAPAHPAAACLPLWSLPVCGGAAGLPARAHRGWALNLDGLRLAVLSRGACKGWEPAAVWQNTLNATACNTHLVWPRALRLSAGITSMCCNASQWLQAMRGCTCWPS